MTANEWQDEAVRLWGVKAAVDYTPGAANWNERFRVLYEGRILGAGGSYEEAFKAAARPTVYLW